MSNDNTAADTAGALNNIEQVDPAETGAAAVAELKKIEWGGVGAKACDCCKGLSVALVEDGVDARVLGHKTNCSLAIAISLLGGEVHWVGQSTSTDPNQAPLPHVKQAADEIQASLNSSKQSSSESGSEASAEEEAPAAAKASSPSDAINQVTSQVSSLMDTAKSNPLVKQGLSRFGEFVKGKPKGEKPEGERSTTKEA